jgi:hypothetical protein
MPTDLPYAADAEQSLSYQELGPQPPFLPLLLPSLVIFHRPNPNPDPDPSAPLSLASGRVVLTAGVDVLKRQYEKELHTSHVSVQTKFNYSWGLVKSEAKVLQMEGVKLLQGTSCIL